MARRLIEQRHFTCAVLMPVIIGPGNILTPLTCFRTAGGDSLYATWHWGFFDCFLFLMTRQKVLAAIFPSWLLCNGSVCHAVKTKNSRAVCSVCLFSFMQAVLPAVVFSYVSFNPVCTVHSPTNARKLI